MPQLPEKPSSPLARAPGLFPAKQADSGAPVALPGLEPQKPEHQAPRWLERAELFLRVLLRMYIGIAVCCVPWMRIFWDHNPIFAYYPTLGDFAANGMVRGLISGLGLLNLWIAFEKAIRHWDK